MRSIVILYIDTLLLEDVADVVLADVRQPSHEARSPLQSFSYVMLTDNDVAEYAAVLLRKLSLVKIGDVDRLMWTILQAVDFNTMPDKKLRQVFKVIELV